MAEARVGDEVVLRARGLCKQYERQVVLNSVDVTMRRGETVALLGPNGSGKTTLMSILVGLIEPTAGDLGSDPRSFGWVPQGGGTYGRLTVRENLRLFASLLHLEDTEAQAERAARRVDLLPWLDHTGWQLSGGLRQRLNLAVGMLGDPPVLVLDEPSTGVDLYQQQKLWQVLGAARERGGSLLYSTHALDEARYADRVLVMARGRVVFDGRLQELEQFDRPDRYQHVNDSVARGLLVMWDTPEVADGVGAHGGELA